MTTRADLIKAGAAAARLNGVGSWEHLAAVVLDAVLPQISTVERAERRQALKAAWDAGYDWHREGHQRYHNPHDPDHDGCTMCAVAS